MDNRELWAITFWGTMKEPYRADNGDLIHDTFTVHVVTDKGYEHALAAARKSSEATWDVVLKKAEYLGGAPLIAE